MTRVLCFLLTPVALVLWLTACGGGGATPGGEARDSSVGSTTNLVVRVLLPANQPRQTVTLRSLTSVRISLYRPENLEVPTQSVEQPVEPNQSEVMVRLLSVLPGSYQIVVEAVDGSSSPLTFSQLIQVNVGQVTSVFANLAAVSPVANDDSYIALSGLDLSVPAALGVLTNDSAASGVAALATSPTSGTLALSPDGSFVYQPAIGFVGADSFTYTLTNSNGSSSATVTITVPGRGLFVKADAPSTGTGTLTDPRPDLDGALAAATAGDVVFAFASPLPLVTATPAGLTDFLIPPGVSLIGEGSGLELNGVTIVPAGSQPIIRNSIQIQSDSTLQGVLVENTIASSVTLNISAFPGNVANVVVDTCDFTTGGGLAVNVFNPTGSLRFTNSNVTCSASGSTGLLLGETTALTATVTLENCGIFADNSALGIFSQAGSSLTTSVKNNSFTGKVTCAANGAGSTMTATVDSNVLTASPIEGIVISNGTQGVIDATVTNNDISNTAGAGISISENSTTLNTVTVQNNRLNQVASGITLFSQGVLDTVIANNTLTNVSGLIAMLRSTGTGVLRVRFDANQATSGDIEVSQLAAGSFDVGIINNTLAGKLFISQQSGAGPLCARIAQNATLSSIEVDNLAADPIIIEGFPNLNPPVTFNFIHGSAVDGGPCSIP
ncbi:MAG: Ig-like domain-containing protein [Vulcanimicrobiota bacterium]